MHHRKSLYHGQKDMSLFSCSSVQCQNMKRMLIVVAHPDDESFGPAGTIALYANDGVEIHLICVTNGDASEQVIPGTETMTTDEQKRILAKTRQQELRNAADILGIAQIDFLNYPDAKLCNELYHPIANEIMAKIELFKPHVIIAPEPQGISGHLDHIAISMITTYSFIKCPRAQKLYYACLPNDIVKLTPHEDYFVYFPEGYPQSIITTRIDYSCFLDKKILAMRQHLSQINEANYLISFLDQIPKTDHFILHKYRNCTVNFPETDLFSGVSS